eukprot:Skav202453  [mRNA]  locus=scaffold149:122758:128900:+ [translate_table: standard]
MVLRAALCVVPDGNVTASEDRSIDLLRRLGAGKMHRMHRPWLIRASGTDAVAKLRPSIISYNALISSYEKCSQWILALEKLRIAKGCLKPNVITWNAILSATSGATSGATSAASAEASLPTWQLTVALLMDHSRMTRPDVISYSTVISSYGKGSGGSQWQLALEVLEQMMSSNGIDPNVISYNALITSCERGFQWQIALSLLRKMSVLKAAWTGGGPTCAENGRVSNSQSLKLSTHQQTQMAFPRLSC